MGSNGRREAHPYADLFPMMTAVELEALSADIAEHGLRQPVVLYGGLVLDGRNRLLACERAKVEPTFVEHEGDEASALALVISLNVQRRDLSSAQRAISAARALPMFEEAALLRKADGGRKKSGTGNPTLRSRTDAASVFKVGEKAVQQAKAILADAPDLAAQVEGRTISLAAAYEVVQARRKEAEQRARDAERIAEYTDAISAGEITFEEACQELLEEEREQRERAGRERQARELFFAFLADVLGRIADRLGSTGDDYLIWYTQEGEPGSDTDITAEAVASAIAHLERVRTITFRGK